MHDGEKARSRIIREFAFVRFVETIRLKRITYLPKNTYFSVYMHYVCTRFFFDFQKFHITFYTLAGNPIRTIFGRLAASSYTRILSFRIRYIELVWTKSISRQNLILTGIHIRFYFSVWVVKNNIILSDFTFGIRNTYNIVFFQIKNKYFYAIISRVHFDVIGAYG